MVLMCSNGKSFFISIFSCLVVIKIINPCICNQYPCSYFFPALITVLKLNCLNPWVGDGGWGIRGWWWRQVRYGGDRDVAFPNWFFPFEILNWLANNVSTSHQFELGVQCHLCCVHSPTHPCFLPCWSPRAGPNISFYQFGFFEYFLWFWFSSF